MAASTTQRPAGSHARRPRSTNRPCMHAYEDVVVPPGVQEAIQISCVGYPTKRTLR
ncbi:hypothetical protein ZEAMMB73_Zm00001d025297 [Zea mays]|uniref:Uncharacterized protein n=1 Tax=Zea mays TaxID=4577 RepID=A0A1D6J6B9_MAIZE|nr:hypothetical protein ZEAMMB73_Zm00001d025297 [Zea mays]